MQSLPRAKENAVAERLEKLFGTEGGPSSIRRIRAVKVIETAFIRWRGRKQPPPDVTTIHCLARGRACSSTSICIEGLADMPPCAGSYRTECDILVHIFGYVMDCRTLFRCFYVCRLWQRLIPHARPRLLDAVMGPGGILRLLIANIEMLSRVDRFITGHLLKPQLTGMWLNVMFRSAPMLQYVYKNVSVQSCVHPASFADADADADPSSPLLQERFVDAQDVVYQLIPPSVVVLHGLSPEPDDWGRMHPDLQLVRFVGPRARLGVESIPHLREATLIECESATPEFVAMLNPEHLPNLTELRIKSLPPGVGTEFLERSRIPRDNWDTLTDEQQQTLLRSGPDMCRAYFSLP